MNNLERRPGVISHIHINRAPHGTRQVNAQSSGSMKSAIERLSSEQGRLHQYWDGFIRRIPVINSIKDKYK